jgi:hypothetical protein
MKKIYLVILLGFVIEPMMGWGQISYPNNAFRSKTGGTWFSTSGTGTATWERYTLATDTWANFVGSPTGSTIVYIAHDIDIPTAAGSLASPSIFIQTGAKLTWQSSSPWTAGNMYLYTGSTLQINTRFTILSTGTFEVEDNATVNFNYGAYSGTNLSSSLWQGTENFHPLSNFVIQNQTTGTGNYFIPTVGDVTANPYSGFTACFGNLIFDSQGTATYDFFGAAFTTKNLTHNDFIIRSAAATTNALRLTAFNLTTTIGRDFIMETGSNRPVSFSNQAGAVLNITINGNLTNTSVKTLSLNAATVGNIFNLKGDLTVGSSSLFTATLSTIFNFNGIGEGSSAANTQTIDVASTNISAQNNISFFVKSGAYVQLINRDFEIGNSGSFTVQGTTPSPGVLDFGYNGTSGWLIKERTSAAPTGTTAFALTANGYLKITHENGIVAAPTIDGNVRLDTRTFDDVATFHYVGKQNQLTGNALPTTSSAKVLICEMNSNSLTLTLSGQTGFSNSTAVNSTYGGHLNVKKGQLIETTLAYVTSNCSGTLRMESGTLYKIAKGNNSAALSIADLIPRMIGASFPYVLTGGTIELAGTGSSDAFQTLRGSQTRPDYFDVKFSGANTLTVDYKNLSSQTVIGNRLTITGTAIVDCVGSPPTLTAQSFTGNGGISMDGGRLRLKSSTNPQPELTGTVTAYALTGGVIEFYNSGTVGNQTVKGTDGNSTAIQYNQIEVTGDKVGNSSSNITLRSGGSFTVKIGGQFEINDNSIVGPTGSQTVTVENGGFFKCGNSKGFHGFTATLTDNSSVHANIENINLNTGSNVIYSRNGDQPITNNDVNAVPLVYSDLTIAGTSGIKTAPSTTLTITDSLKKEGASTFAHNSSNVLFSNSSSKQVFTNTGSTAFNLYNLTNSNLAATTGLSIEGDLGVANSLVLSANSRLTLTSANITMLSDNSRTAYVDEVPLSAVVAYGTGKFEIQRYLPIATNAAARRWRLLTAPIKTTNAPTINAAWQEGQTRYLLLPVALALPLLKAPLRQMASIRVLQTILPFINM